MSVNCRLMSILIIVLVQMLSAAKSDFQTLQNIPQYALSREGFVTDDQGNILMYVNIWGHVAKPGHYLVYEGIDLATLISIAGGPLIGTNLRRVKLFRDSPDESNRIFYQLNLTDFYKSGEREEFVHIKPNDIIIFEPTLFGTILNQAGLVNMLLQILNMSLQIYSISTR